MYVAAPLFERQLVYLFAELSTPASSQPSHTTSGTGFTEMSTFTG